MLRALLGASLLALGFYTSACLEISGTDDPENRSSCGCGEALLDEVAALRSEPLAFVVKLGKPYMARQVLTGQKLRVVGDKVNCTDAGKHKRWPWRLKVDISVTKGPYRKEHRAILEFDFAYPQTLPTLRFGSKLGSIYLSDVDDAHSHVPTQSLIMALSREAASRGKTSLREFLTVLHRMLTKPLEETEKRMWKERASLFKSDTDVVKKYRKKKKNDRFFTVRGFTGEGLPDPVEAPLRAALANISGWSDQKEAKARLLASGVLSEVIPGMVYSFRVFTLEFCALIVEELRNFHLTGLPAKRPNSMNNYGVILNEIGMEPLMFAIQDEVIQPLAAVLFPKEGSELESHHAFTVRYKGGEDTHLDVHTDDSDVTFNVNIFGEYKGCPLVFCGIVGAPDHRHFKTAYQHRLGYAVMHSGRHRHGAEDITKGERVNLIIWSYSYNFRLSAASKKKHKREKAPPDRRCVSYTHDRDFGNFREYPPLKRAEFEGRGWCPQRGKEYAGFVPDAPERPARGRGYRLDDDDDDEL